MSGRKIELPLALAVHTTLLIFFIAISGMLLGTEEAMLMTAFLLSMGTTIIAMPLKSRLPDTDNSSIPREYTVGCAVFLALAVILFIVGVSTDFDKQKAGLLVFFLSAGSYFLASSTWIAMSFHTN